MQFRVPAAVALLMLVSTAANADALMDLRAALPRLPGRDPLHATFDVSRSRHATGRFLTENFQGSVSIDVEADASGLRVMVPRATLDRATDEQAARGFDPKRTTPTSSVLDEVIPVSAENAVSGAHPLLDLVLRGTLIEQRVESFQGKPTRVVVLRLPNKSGSGTSDAVSIEDDRLTVWIGSDNIPVAADRVRKGKVGIMLLHADTLRHEQWTYAVRGDHLCVTRFEDHSVMKGLGQDGTASTTWVLHG